MTPPRRTTIRDVAARAGVSISSVSHTFSGARPISPRTQQRILQAAADLGYEPDPSARSLRVGRSGMIGLLLRPRHAVSGDRRRAETFNRLLGSVTTEMLRRRSAVVYVPDVDDAPLGAVAMDACIVAHPYRDDEAVTVLLRRGVRLVLIDEDPARDAVPWVVRLDYHTAMTALLDHLQEQGAPHATLVSGAEENAWNVDCRAAYSSWCRSRGLPDRVHVVDENLDPDEVGALGRALLVGPDRPAALVVAASDYAAPIAAVAADLGLHVPRDLLVASLSDTEHTRRSSPPITALDLRHEDLAAAAVDLAFRLLAGDPAPAGPVVVRPHLLVRASTLRDGGP